MLQSFADGIWRRITMNTQQLPRSESDSLTADPKLGTFSSTQWLLYFQDNKKSRADIKFTNDIAIPLSMRAPLIRSLQRFQIGETGEGKHLRKYARMTKDPTYEECIDLFIKEEQYHALVLAQIIQSMDGTLLSWHWTDLAFIVLRRMLGLKTEIFILLIAEIIGKCFYNACSNKLDDPRLRDAFALIVLDEIGHLEFHCDFLREQMKDYPKGLTQVCYSIWSFLFLTACFVFIFDHRHSLEALKVRPRDFLEDCSRTFRRSAIKADMVPSNL
jgi:hypothetical protein